MKAKVPAFLAVTLCLLVPLPASAGDGGPEPVRTLAASKKTQRAKVASLRKGIEQRRQEAWSWQRTALLHPTRSSYSERRTTSLPYLRWIEGLWSRRAKAARLHAQNPPHKAQWLCIHRYEGSWSDPEAPFWGGLQMDRVFMAGYGAAFVRKYGGQLRYTYEKGKWALRAYGGEADKWTPLEQMWAAEKAHRKRGFGPWPNTARYCGLL